MTSKLALGYMHLALPPMGDRPTLSWRASRPTQTCVRPHITAENSASPTPPTFQERPYMGIAKAGYTPMPPVLPVLLPLVEFRGVLGNL